MQIKPWMGYRHSILLGVIHMTPLSFVAKQTSPHALHVRIL